MKTAKNHKHVRIGKYIYSATYYNGRWNCDQWPAWGRSAEEACWEFHSYIVKPKKLQQAQAHTVAELHNMD